MASCAAGGAEWSGRQVDDLVAADCGDTYANADAQAGGHRRRHRRFDRRCTRRWRKLMSASRNTAISSPTEPPGPARRHTRPLLVAMAHARMQIQPAFAAYVLWRETQLPDARDDAFHRALPVIGRVVIRLYFATRGDVGGLDEDDLVSVAAADLHGALARGGYTGRNPYEYHNFLRGVARRAVMKELKKNRYRVYDYASRCSTPPAARLQCTQDMEFKVFLERLPLLLYRQTCAAIEGSARIDPPERRLSLHVLTCLLSGRPLLAPRILAGHFRLDRAQVRFITDWTTVAVRRHLYTIRDELHDGRVVDDWYDLFRLYELESESDEDEEDDRPS